MITPHPTILDFDTLIKKMIFKSEGNNIKDESLTLRG
jgi:hypothetical protein